MKRHAYIVVIACALLGVYTTCAGGKESDRRVVSIRVLQRRLAADGDDADFLRRLCGLTKVEGYIVDSETAELFLYGITDDNLPPLYLEDFVVALRNTFMVYAELRDNTYYYSNPGCSIDPDPTVLRQLEKVLGRINNNNDTTKDQIDEAIESWHDICHQPQAVRVMGIPFDTRFAKVMVDADYLMKRIVDGSVDPGVEGLKSHTEMTMEQVKEAVRKNRSVSMSSTILNRFWFCPGRNTCSYNEGIVSIDESPVVLLTEEEHLTRANKIAASGRRNESADEFCEQFSSHYAEIAEKDLIYSELESLFRFVALTRIMKKNKVRETADLDYLLEGFEITRTHVPRELEGISNVEGFEHRRKVPDGYETYRLWMPSCGGVSIDIEADAIVASKDRDLLEIRKKLLSGRSPADSLYWDARRRK